MKGILLASHGRLAEGLLDTLQIFCGELQQMQALGVFSPVRKSQNLWRSWKLLYKRWIPERASGDFLRSALWLSLQLQCAIAAGREVCGENQCDNGDEFVHGTGIYRFRSCRHGQGSAGWIPDIRESWISISC